MFGSQSTQQQDSNGGRRPGCTGMQLGVLHDATAWQHCLVVVGVHTRHACHVHVHIGLHACASGCMLPLAVSGVLRAISHVCSGQVQRSTIACMQDVYAVPVVGRAGRHRSSNSAATGGTRQRSIGPASASCCETTLHRARRREQPQLQAGRPSKSSCSASPSALHPLGPGQARPCGRLS